MNLHSDPNLGVLRRKAHEGPPHSSCIFKENNTLHADCYETDILEEDEFDEDTFLGYKNGFDANGGWEDNPFEGPANPDY